MPYMQLRQGEQAVTIRIRNWSKHQHFKDRTPPWIKLYRDILDDPDWHGLSGDDAKTLVGLWLVASEDETRTGALPNSRKLAFRLRITESELNQQLNRMHSWLERVDIIGISSQHQHATPETETEGEKEKATVHSAAPTAQDAIAVPDGLPDDIAAPVAPGSADKAKRIRGEKKPQTAARFPEFYAAYPVKKDRAKAEAAWRKRGCDDIADTLIAHVRRMESEDSHWGRGFIIHPTTYINGERWTDEPTKDVQAVGKAEPSGKLPAAKDVMARGESALEAALGHIRQRHSLGAYGDGEEGQAEYQRQVQAATDRHRGKDES